MIGVKSVKQTQSYKKKEKEICPKQATGQGPWIPTNSAPVHTVIYRLIPFDLYL